MTDIPLKMHQFPWPRLNSLLFGFPGISIEAATKGGLGNGEVLALCGGPASFKTTVVAHIAWYFMDHEPGRILFITNDDHSIRQHMGQVRATRWDPNRFDIRDVDMAQVDGTIEGAPSDTSLVIVDRPLGRNCASELHVAALKRDLPIIVTVQIGRGDASAKERMPKEMSTTLDHIIGLHPTLDRRYLVMEVAHSRRLEAAPVKLGVGVLLLRTPDMVEVL